MEQNLSERHRFMTETPVRKLIVKLSIPATFSMLVTSVYGFADAWFISQLGTAASGAVGIVFSVTSLLQAVGFTLGNGAGSLLSRFLGEKKRENANGVASLAFWLSLVVGLTLGILGLVFLSPVVHFLGATETIYPYAASYAVYLFCAAPMICGSFVLNNLLRAEGKVTYSMVGFVVGNILNIALDPLFIFTFGMGCAGASLATLISQTVSLLILLSAYVFKQSGISLHPKHIKPHIRSLGNVLLTGLPSLFRQGLASLASILLTRTARQWGDAAVAAVSVVSRIFLLLYSFCLGIGQGMMPAAGFNKGDGQQKRVTELYRFALILATAIMFLLAVPTAIFAPQIIGFFRPDQHVIAIGKNILRAHCAVLTLHGIIAVTNMFLQAIGNRFGAALLAAARQGIFFLPLIFWLPNAFGLGGLEWTQALADLLTFGLTLPFLILYFKKAKSEPRDT